MSKEGDEEMIKGGEFEERRKGEEERIGVELRGGEGRMTDERSRGEDEREGRGGEEGRRGLREEET